jgi:hypothetical protein
MNFLGGIILCAVAVVMLFLGRARGGEPLHIFRVWIVGQIYALAILGVGVIGVAVIIINWPF